MIQDTPLLCTMHCTTSSASAISQSVTALFVNLWLWVPPYIAHCCSSTSWLPSYNVAFVACEKRYQTRNKQRRRWQHNQERTTEILTCPWSVSKTSNRKFSYDQNKLAVTERVWPLSGHFWLNINIIILIILRSKFAFITLVVLMLGVLILKFQTKVSCCSSFLVHHSLVHYPSFSYSSTCTSFIIPIFIITMIIIIIIIFSLNMVTIMFDQGAGASTWVGGRDCSATSGTFGSFVSTMIFVSRLHMNCTDFSNCFVVC